MDYWGRLWGDWGEIKMDAKESIIFINGLLQKYGVHLDYIQSAIIKGCYECNTYKFIAEQIHISPGHVADRASELWVLLSKILGVRIKKNNVTVILEMLRQD